ncbi:MAG TPA: dienelactone hydrolase family protein [Steroidobacteraceae bacterium]|nr:dienelactone hydrolase family protein [Steroidobacteraceae bacterium]
MSARNKDGKIVSGAPDDRSRRNFVALSAAAGLVAVTRPAAVKAAEIVEREVEIRTAAGTCDAAFIHPAAGVHPGALIWTDIFGLRPSMREMGRRLAGAGYSVLVPNPFYRTARAPVFGDISGFNFQNEADRARLPPLTDPLNAPGAAEVDARAYVEFLDGQRQVDKARKIGCQGYCMGGPLVMRTAASNPDRVGAGASFHGGGLVTNQPTSPHLLAPKIRARMYFAIAAGDDARQPDVKYLLRTAFEAAKGEAEIEVYTGTKHGWCVPDMPPQSGAPIYSQSDAERAWAKLLELYRAALA